MVRNHTDAHSCSYCRSLIIDPATAYTSTNPDFKSRVCPCSQCQRWLKRIQAAHEDPLFIILDSKPLLQARLDGCITARQLTEAWDEDDDENIERLSRRGISFETTDVVIWCDFREPDRHDICRLQVRGPHLVSVSGQPPKGDYGVCIEDEYGIAAVRGDPASEFLSGREVHRDMNDPELYRMAADWVRDCLQHHSACRNTVLNLNRFQPARLLRVDKSDLGSSHVRIVPIEQLPRIVRYVALSYCWGGDQPGKTVKANIQRRLRQGLKIAEQPKTIRDAIRVTGELGIPYLWIDSLCIIQDDPHDIARELASMEKIYEYADLLISAARARSSAEGMLNPVMKLSINVSCGYQCPNGQVGTILLQKIEGDSGSRGVHERCWTLQEHLLPPRILSYADSGLRWCCRTTSLFDGPWSTKIVFVNFLENIETYRGMSAVLSTDPTERLSRVIGDGQVTMLRVDEGLVPELLHRTVPRWRRDTSKESANEGRLDSEESNIDSQISSILQWRRLLREFTSRSITNPADRLPAISAAAKRFNKMIPGLYVAGLWEVVLPIELLWEPQAGGRKGRDQQQLFPSWSWASTSHRVEWSNPPARKVTIQCLEACLALLYPSVPYGHVTKGSLRVRGFLTPVVCDTVGVTLDPTEWNTNSNYGIRLEHGVLLFPRLANDLPANGTKMRRTLGLLDEIIGMDRLQNLYCLEVLRGGSAGVPSAGLVLAPMDQLGTFKRVGVFGTRWAEPRSTAADTSDTYQTLFETFSERREVVLV